MLALPLPGIVRDRSRMHEESKDTGDNGSTLLPFDLNQQHRPCGFVDDERPVGVDEAPVVRSTVTADGASAGVLAPDDQRSDLIELNLEWPGTLAGLRWRHVSDGVR